MDVSVISKEEVPAGKRRGMWIDKLRALQCDEALKVIVDTKDELLRQQSIILGCMRHARRTGLLSNYKSRSKRDTSTGQFILYVWLEKEND